MSFSFCLNKNELLLLAGFGLLFQGLNSDRKGRLVQDSQRLLCSVIEILERNAATGASEFKRIACAMISVKGNQKGNGSPDQIAGRRKSDGNMAAPKESTKSTRKLQNIASRYSTGNAPVMKRESSSGRRSTAPTPSTGQLSCYGSASSQNSVPSVVSDSMHQHEYSQRTTISQPARQSLSIKPLNLDYLSFSDLTSSPNNMSPGASQQYMAPDLASTQMEPPLDSLFPSEDVFSSYVSPPPSADLGWGTDNWALHASVGNQAGASQSRISFSEEDVTSGEELSSCDVGADFRGLAMPGLDGLDGNFGL